MTAALRPPGTAMSRALVVEAPEAAVVSASTPRGGPVAMPWLDRALSVVQGWFGGQELGGALADVLGGRSEPAGRMPFTVPRRIEDTPTYGNFPGEAGEVRYGEGLLVGHRWYDARDIPVVVPFGHGLTYAGFDWTDVALVGSEASSTEVTVELTVTNTGDRAGSEVVQTYVSPPADTPLFRPRRELKGFAKVHLDPGASHRVRIALDWRSFAYWTPHDTAVQFHEQVLATPFAPTVSGEVPPVGWTVHPGTYRIDVARSVADVEAVVVHEIHEPIRGTWSPAATVCD